MRYAYRLSLLVTCLLVFISLSGQRVGVGTTNPSDALHVNGGAADNPLRVQINGATKFRILNNGGTTIGVNNVNGTTDNGLYVHGNTGLGVSFAADRLAVGGDMNVTGVIKANGTAGTEGQVLASNGTGGMEWVDLCQYRNFMDFINEFTTSWTVPAGVTEAVFEVWGGGGGGSSGGGGGAGGYVRVKVVVSAGEVYTVTVGDGGSAGSAGQNTVVSGPGIVGPIQGNGGAAGNTAGPGLGGTASSPTGYQATRIRGQSGQPNTLSFAEYASGSFAEIIHYGRGGQTGMNTVSAGTGQTRAENTVTSAVLYSSSGRPGLQPGGGGGGGTSGYPGGDGYAIVRW